MSLQERIHSEIYRRLAADIDSQLFFGTSVTVEEPGVLTVKMIEDACRALPAPRPALRVQSSPYWPTEYSHTDTVRVDAHSFIKWLAKYLPIDPWVEALISRYRDCDPMVDDKRGVVYCSLRQEQIIQNQLDQQ